MYGNTLWGDNNYAALRRDLAERDDVKRLWDENAALKEQNAELESQLKILLSEREKWRRELELMQTERDDAIYQAERLRNQWLS
jgi:hypothetical protein